MFKLCSIDIETTGINHQLCDILEFGCVLDYLGNTEPIDSLPKFHCYFLPVNDGVYRGEPYALSMHPVIFKRIAEKEKGYTYLSPSRFGFAFKKFLLDNGYEAESDRTTINVAGKNPSFDISFLEGKTDMLKHVKMRHRVLDPSILFLSKDDESIPGMGECKKRMSLESTVEHNAIADALDVIKMIRYKMEQN